MNSQDWREREKTKQKEKRKEKLKLQTRKYEEKKDGAWSFRDKSELGEMLST